MSCVVTIDGIISFAPNFGIWIADTDKAMADPQRLVGAIALAKQHWQDEVLVLACCGAGGPLYRVGSISFEDYILRSADFRRAQTIHEVTREIKSEAIKARRREFQAIRPRLLLQMLEAGHLYVCAEEGCDEADGLHIDHIEPLSRGGSDDLSNLQFLCASHNSKKGASA